jgi:nucleoside-diphosphate-sugar epimerase
MNVDCAVNLFEVCEKHQVPVLFISTVDAIGMVKGVIKPDTELNPISNYGKSKALAESRLKEICSVWNIYRFSPVYTEDVKRDIQKRYYLIYPDWAYLIGSGQQFEVLNVRKAVSSMVDWADKPVDNTIHIIKDIGLLNSAKVIAEERAEVRAQHVIKLPRWMVVCGYYCIRFVFGKSNKTYLVFKALWPFRTVEV